MKKKDLRHERKQQRKEENRKFILKAAERVFAQKGYSLATMDDIAEEAQFSKATIYRYHKSKRDIFIEIVLSSFDETHQKVAKITDMEISAGKKLQEIISCLSSYYHRKKNIIRIYFMERATMNKILNIKREENSSYPNHHPKIPHEFRAKMKQISDVMSEVINEGIESGEFRKVNVKEATFVLRAMLRGFHFRGPMPDEEISLNESVDLLHSFFLYGIKKEG